MIAPGIAGLALIAFSFSKTPALSMALLAVVGFSFMVQMGSSNIVVQTIVDEDKRGRVMSFYTMAFMGLSPLGSLLFGSLLAGYFGAANAIRIGGAACVVGSLLFSLHFRRLRALIRPIYVRMGILPEMASGVYPAIVAAVAATGTGAEKTAGGIKVAALLRRFSARNSSLFVEQRKEYPLRTESFN